MTQSIKITWIILCLFQGIGLSQDVLFSSLNNTPLSINPALAGCNNKLQSNILYRNQWLKSGNPYNSFLASGEIALSPKKINYFGIGIECSSFITSSKMNTTSFRTSLAYNLQVDDYNKFSFALYGGVIGMATSNNGRWGTQYDGYEYNGSLASGENMNQSQSNKLDVGAGLVYSSKNSRSAKTPTFQCGIASYHLNKPNLTLYSNGSNKLPIRYSAFANLCLPFDEGRKEFCPSGYINLQNKFFTYMVGGIINFKLIHHTSYNMYQQQKGSTTLITGLYYRSNGALVSQFAIQKSFWNIGLTYDINLFPNNRVLTYKSSTEINLKFYLPH